MEDKEKIEVKKIIDLMLDFLFAYSDDASVNIENEVNRILITFTVNALDERVRTNMLRTIKKLAKLNYPNSSKLDEISNMVSDVRMETTDDETKIMLIKDCQV